MSTKLNRIKKLENIISPKEFDSFKYYALNNGKYIIIPPGKEGVKTIIEFIYEGTYTESSYTLEQIKEQHPDIKDNTENINSIIQDIKGDF